MEPKTFGPFLRETRKRRGLTQEQLAERLRVSGAAVSKWENGRCLPDLSKIGDLADVLDLSVLELMKCEIHGVGEVPAPRQAMSEVFSETVKTVERRRRRLTAAVLAAAVCAAVLAILLHYFPMHHMAHVPLYYYDGQEISMLLYIGSREERRTAQAVLAQAERAFSDVGLSYEEAENAYGQLGRYCITDDRVSAETHQLELWSARFDGSTGYMWIHYSRSGYDKTGKKVTGSRAVAALWHLGKNWDGDWVVMDIREHP